MHQYLDDVFGKHATLLSMVSDGQCYAEVSLRDRSVLLLTVGCLCCDKLLLQIVVDSFNLKMDSAQHREDWSGSVTDVLGVIKGNGALFSVQHSV